MNLLSRMIEWITDIPYRLMYDWNKQCLWLLMGILNIGLTFLLLVWYTMPKEERPILSVWAKVRVIAVILPEKPFSLSVENKSYRLPAKAWLKALPEKEIKQHLKSRLVLTSWIIGAELLLIMAWIATPYLQSKKMQYLQKKGNAKPATIVAVPSQQSNHDNDKTQHMTTEQTVAKTQPPQKMLVGDPPNQQKKKQRSKNKTIVKSDKLNVIRHTKAVNKKTLDDVDVVL